MSLFDESAVTLDIDGNFESTAAPLFDDEPEHVEVTYGDPYVKLTGLVSETFQAVTTTTVRRYRYTFLTKAAALKLAGGLKKVYDAEGAALSPAKNVATIIPRRAYRNDGYDVEVNYAKAITIENSLG